MQIRLECRAIDSSGNAFCCCKKAWQCCAVRDASVHFLCAATKADGAKRCTLDPVVLRGTGEPLMRAGGGGGKRVREKIEQNGGQVSEQAGMRLGGEDTADILNPFCL